jgi:hypothetical protein
MGLLGFCLAVLVPAAGRATELEPNEFVAAPAGTTAVLGYLVYGEHQSYRPVGGPSVSQGMNLTDVLGIARASQYFNIGKVEALVEFLQPFGGFSNAKIAGADLAGSSGAGDTTIAAAIWPVNDKAARRYLGLTLYLTLPDGAYDRAQVINLGGNRMVYDPEIAFHQGIDDHWSFDVSTDVIAYGDNTQPSVLAHQTLSQAPTVQVQGFVNYAWAKRVVTSIGYEGERGGRQSLDGVDAAAETNFDEVRFVNSYAVTPAFQVLGEVNHQFSNMGGFKQGFGVTLRTLYAF